MLFKSLCLLSILILSGCLSNQPKPRARPECQIMRTTNLQDTYLHCVWSDTKETYQQKLSDLPVEAQTDKDIYVCTTLKGYVEIKTYQANLQSWINKWCGR